MKTKYWNTLLALSLVAALWGGFTYWDKRKSSETSKSETKREEKVCPLDSNHIQSFGIKPRDGQPFTCRREGSNWVLLASKKLAADSSNVSAFLNTLTSATVDQVVEPHPANLKDFGLDPPATTLEVTTDTKPERFTLLLGDETPTSGGVYAQVAGNPRVVTLASYVKSSLAKNLFDLSDRRAVTLDADRLQRIEAESESNKWALVKNPEGVWDLVLPPPVRADRFTAEGLVTQVRNLTIQSIVADDKKNAAKFGIGTPALRLKLVGQEGNQTLLVGKKENGKTGNRYVAMNSALDPLFTVSSDFLTQFEKKPADLREKDLFSFSAFDARRVEVETPKGNRVFERQNAKWKQTSPTVKEIAADKVETLLNRLRDFRADSFPKGTSLAAFGLTRPAYRFRVQFGDKNQTEMVEASKAAEHVYARRSTDALPCELTKSALEDVEKALADL